LGEKALADASPPESLPGFPWAPADADATAGACSNGFPFDDPPDPTCFTSAEELALLLDELSVRLAEPKYLELKTVFMTWVVFPWVRVLVAALATTSTHLSVQRYGARSLFRF